MKDEEHETLSVFTATWHYACAQPDGVDRIGVQSFKAFPSLLQLQVQFITESHQGNAVLKP